MRGELRRGDPCPFCQSDHLSGPACHALAELFESSDPDRWWEALNYAAGARVTVEPDPAYHGTRIHVRLVHGFSFGPAVERPWVNQDHEVRVDDFALAMRERTGPYANARREILQLGARMLESWKGPGARGAAVAVRLLCLRGPAPEAFSANSRGARRQLEGWGPGPLAPSWPGGDFRPPTSSLADGEGFRRDMAMREEAEEEARREALRQEIRDSDLSDHFWRWQGDGYDHLESLSCPVLIEPHQLAKIIDRKTAPECRENHSATGTGHLAAWAARARGRDADRRLGS